MEKEKLDKIQVAVYWDFENIHASVLRTKGGNDAYKINIGKKQEAVINIDAIMGYIHSIGNVSINKAYCNWSFFGNYREQLLNYSIDLIQLYPRGMNSKNGEDIRMSLDAGEDIHHFPHLTHFVIIGGDSDFVGLAQLIRKKGKTIIGIAEQSSSNRFWEKACTEFKYYATILNKTEISNQTSTSDEDKKKIAYAKKLLITAIERIMTQKGTDYALKSMIKPMMTRLDTTFDEGNYIDVNNNPYKSFVAFLGDCKDVILIDRNEHDQIVKLKSMLTISKN